MNALRTVTILGGDRRPGERMPALSEALKPTLIVQDDIPPPTLIKGQRSEARKVIDALQPGQSVWVPFSMHKRETTRMLIKSAKAENGHQYTSKTEGQGVRVWRIK